MHQPLTLAHDNSKSFFVSLSLFSPLSVCVTARSPKVETILHANVCSLVSFARVSLFFFSLFFFRKFYFNFFADEIFTTKPFSISPVLSPALLNKMQLNGALTKSFFSQGLTVRYESGPKFPFSHFLQLFLVGGVLLGEWKKTSDLSDGVSLPKRKQFQAGSY